MAFGSLDGGDDVAYDPMTGLPIGIPADKMAGQPSAVQKVIGGMLTGLKQQVELPGAAMKANPYPDGSEEAAWYDQNRQDTLANWAPGMALNTMGTGAIAGVPLRAGEAALGAGAVRPKLAEAPVPAAIDHPAHNPSLQQAFHAEMGPDKGNAAYEAYIAAHGEPPNVAGQTPVGEVGGRGGDPGLSEAQASAQRWAGSAEPLAGLPTKPIRVNDQWIVPGPIGSLREVADSYMAGRPAPSYHRPPEQYHPIDPEHSRAIAQAFEEMPHAPDDPHVKASYDALAKETRDQFRHIVDKTGLKVEPIPAGMTDPYAANPRLAAKDVAENNHLWFYPTEHGFGSQAQGGIDMLSHPMMQPSGEMLNGKPLLNNDIFRIVHDVFGHLKEGHGFRAAGEDNAWRSHAAMYSDLARPAMTTETRGQNSWVNFGPHAERNRTASGAETIYADQKAGLLPEWAMRDRGSPEPWIVHHGTPHAFDQFDFSKIGAGEGNQAYGHGLYFAEHSPVSEWYRHQLASRRDPLLEKYGLGSEDGARMGIDLANSGGDHKALVTDLTDYVKENRDLQAKGDTSMATKNIVDRSERMIRYLNDPNRFQGYRYQVAIDRPREHFLEWEKPLREQSPYVQEKLQPMLDEFKAKREAALPERKSSLQEQVDRATNPKRRAELQARLNDLDKPVDFANHTGEQIYNMAAIGAKNRTEGHPVSTQKLRDMGIGGIRYLDGSSRVAGGTAKSSNVVTFDSPRILTRFTPPAEAPRAPANTFPVKETAKERSMREQTGYGHVATVDAEALRAELEGKKPGSLSWSEEKNAAVSSPDYTASSYPRVSADGKIAVEDGGHRIAAAARNGQKIEVAVKSPEEAARLEGLGQPAAPAIAAGRSRFVDPDSGMAIPGPAYTKEAQRVGAEIAAGPKGAGPMDMGLQGKIPDVLQTGLERYDPPRGVPARMQDAIENPAVREGLAQSMEAGAGVRDWYHTEPVRQEFLKTLGPEEGEAAFKRFMDIVAATSPRSDVPTNVRNASYYYAGGDPAKANPYPYGHVVQNLHRQNVANLAERGGWDVMQNPKPASFAENLRGNLEPVTVDTHAFRNIGMRTGDPRFLETSISKLYKEGHAGAEDTLGGKYGEIRKNAKGETVVTYRPQQLVKDGKLTMEEAQNIPSFWAAKPKDTEYAAAENLFREVGAKVGMRPADAQAAAWAGAGDMTGLGTVGTHTFPELMNERVLFTAKMRGQEPRQVLRDFITGKKPLLSLAGGAAVAYGSMDGGPTEARAQQAADGDFKPGTQQSDREFMSNIAPSWYSGMNRAPVDDRRQEGAPSPYPAEGLEFRGGGGWIPRPGEIEEAISYSPSLLARTLGAGELDRSIGTRMLRDAMVEKQMNDAMKKSEPARRRAVARAFGSLDGGE